MGNYVPSSQAERVEMLRSLGLESPRELYKDVPADIFINGLDLDNGLSEQEVTRLVTEMAEKNKPYRLILRGAGAYDHFIPAIIKRVVSKEEFLTAYTPYQAEISQGILQSIFEYQTDICELTGMDVSNASVYDGASAAAEAVAMCRDSKRSRVLISAAVNPETIATVTTYCNAAGSQVELIPCPDGITDFDAFSNLMSDNVSCVVIQQPNFFGLIENAAQFAGKAHEFASKAVMSVYPISSPILKTPRECGFDVAVGEGQPLGMPLSFGGPYLGFMACTHDMMRKLPGRIVGQTADAAGNRCFVLTLQAREQHIRREKASSNICSNQALCAMTAAVYLAAMGSAGLEEAAVSCCSNAHYLAQELIKLDGVKLKFPNHEFFNEFMLIMPKRAEILALLEENGILGGLEVDDSLLWCTTEKHTKAYLDLVVKLVKEAIQ